MRQFKTGATRDDDDGKLDYEGFLSPEVLHAYAEYLHRHRVQADGSLRPSDNWQLGIGQSVYMKSAWRHFWDWWAHHRKPNSNRAHKIDAICALIFNAMGYLHEELNNEKPPRPESLPIFYFKGRSLKD